MSKIILLVLLIFNVHCLAAADLHAFIVASTSEEGIGDANELNLDMWKHFLAKIEVLTPLTVKAHYYTEARAATDFVKDYETIQVGPDDVLIFYWSGHGFRPSNLDPSVSPWPFLGFAGGERRALDFDHVTTLLQSKQPRLFIACAETCNDVIPFSFMSALVRLETMDQADDRLGQKEIVNITRLFLETRGSLRISASSPGQSAYASNEEGSLYTICFFRAFNKKVFSNDQVDWESILSLSADYLKKYRDEDVQVPYFEVDIHPLD